MGKIPQYSRQKFQSTYVGGPQVDKSGSMLAEGANAALAPVLEQATRTEEAKIQASIEQQADNAVVQYSLKYQNMVTGLQEQYANDPAKVPLTAIGEGEKLAGAMGQGIPDERVRARFLAGTNAMNKQSASALTKWGVAKQKENGEIAALDKVNTMAFTLGQTDNFATFENNLINTITEASKLPGVQQEGIRKALPGFYDTHTYLRATSDPDGFEKDLDNYKDLPYLPKDFRVKALKAIEAQRKKEKTEMVIKQRENRYTLGNEIIDKSYPLVDMFARIDEVKNSDNGEGLTTSDYGWLKKTLFNSVKAGVADMQEEDPKRVSDKYLEAINKIATNETDRRQRQAAIIELSQDGFSKQEVQELNSLYGFSNDTKIQQGVGFLKSFMETISRVEDVNTKVAHVKELVSRLAKGEEPNKVVAEVSAAALTYQAWGDNPSIIHYPPSGQLMVDSSGAYARVYPDGRKEER